MLKLLMITFHRPPTIFLLVLSQIPLLMSSPSASLAAERNTSRVIQVLDADGAPATNASVWRVSPPQLEPLPPLRPDRSGRVEIAELTSTLWFSMPGHASAGDIVPNLPEVVRLQRSFSVTGRVVFADGTPAVGARVGFDHPAEMISPFPDQGLADMEVLTGSDGRYVLPGIVSISYRGVLTFISARKQVDGSIWVGNLGEADDIVLREPKKLSGRVLDTDGNPIASAGLTFSGQGPVRWTSSHVCDGKGAFAIESINARQFKVSAPGFHSVLFQPLGGTIWTSPSENLEVRLQKQGKVRGRIVSKSSGKPVPNSKLWRIRLMGGSSPASACPGWGASYGDCFGTTQPSFAGPDGVFEADWPTGTASLSVDGYSTDRWTHRSSLHVKIDASTELVLKVAPLTNSWPLPERMRLLEAWSAKQLLGVEAIPGKAIPPALNGGDSR